MDAKLEEFIPDGKIYLESDTHFGPDEEYFVKPEDYDDSEDKRHRAWVFTWNNYPKDYKNYLKKDNLPYKWICYSQEIAPSTGTKHIQGAFYLEDAKTYSSVRSKLGDSAWISVMRGTCQQSYNYCSKNKNPTFCTDGTMPKQGTRWDLINIINAVKSGVPMKTLIVDVKDIRLIRYVEKIYSLYEPERKGPMKAVRYFYGLAGTGKTFDATREDKEKFGYYKTWSSDTKKWFHNYDGEDAIIIDDFRANSSAEFCSFSSLLKLLQPYPEQIEFKGGYRQFLATHITITSCQSVMDIYPYLNEDKAQLFRRISEIRYYYDTGKYVSICFPGDINKPERYQIEEWTQTIKIFCVDPLEYDRNRKNKFYLRKITTKPNGSVDLQKLLEINEYLDPRKI